MAIRRTITMVLALAVLLLCAASPILAAEGGENVLDPTKPKVWNFWGDTALWTGVVFLVVLAILYKSAWRPILDGLQKREEGIASQINDAQQKNDEARKLLADYEKKLTDAQAEVRGLIEQGKRDAEKIGQQIVDKAREDAAIEHQRALQRIESATSAALKELAEKSATLAVELAGKIVGAQLKPADHSRLIEQAVSAFTHSGQGRVNGASKN